MVPPMCMLTQNRTIVNSDSELAHCAVIFNELDIARYICLYSTYLSCYL